MFSIFVLIQRTLMFNIGKGEKGTKISKIKVPFNNNIEKENNNI